MKTIKFAVAVLLSTSLFTVPAAAQDDLTADSIRQLLVPAKTRAIAVVPVNREEKTLYDTLEQKSNDPTAFVEEYEREEIYAVVKEYKMPALDLDIYFDTGSSAITPKAAALLDKLVEALSAEKQGEFLINGHTDARGSALYNQTLSEQRAHAVRAYLVDKGIKGLKLVALGYGEEQLKDTGEPASEVNRRVEVVNFVPGK